MALNRQTTHRARIGIGKSASGKELSLTFHQSLPNLDSATTTDVYMQEIPESVKATVAAINKELRLKPQAVEASKISGLALPGGLLSC